MDNTDNLKPAQTVLLACVIREDTHDKAVEELRRLLDVIFTNARAAKDEQMVSFVDECWLPNDCDNSEWPVIWAHEVTAADLIRAQMQKAAPTSMSEQARKYAKVRKGEPALSMWEDDIEDSAACAAEQVLPIAYGVRMPGPRNPA